VVVCVSVCRQDGLCIPGVLVAFLVPINIIVDRLLGLLLEDGRVGKLPLAHLLLELLRLLALLEIFSVDDFGGLDVREQCISLLIAILLCQVHEPSLFILNELIASVVKHFFINFVFSLHIHLIKLANLVIVVLLVEKLLKPCINLILIRQYCGEILACLW